MSVELPGFEDPWAHENAFYWTCDVTRMAKLLAQYELFKQVLDVPGAIVECGVFKGASLLRLAMFRELLAAPHAKPVVAFDTFGPFPEATLPADRAFREGWVREAGAESIAVKQLEEVLAWKRCDRNVELVAGDIRETVPHYAETHPALRISLLNLDVDVYEPAVVVLEHLYPRVERGGIVLLDDHGAVAGETRAVDEFFGAHDVAVRKLPFALSPCYVVKP